MSNQYFVFKRKDSEGKYIPYAAVYLPAVQSVQYINDGRKLLIILQPVGEVTVACGENTNDVDFFDALSRLKM